MHSETHARGEVMEYNFTFYGTMGQQGDSQHMLLVPTAACITSTDFRGLQSESMK